MPVSFTAQDGKDPVRSLQDFISQGLPNPAKFPEAGQQQITRIKNRTAQGVDVNGRTFAPYSEKYAKLRAKRGQRVSPPDLRGSGRLLDEMNVEVLNDHQFAIHLGSGDAAQIAAALNDGTAHMPARHFFATSPQELRQMMEAIVEKPNV